MSAPWSKAFTVSAVFHVGLVAAAIGFGSSLVDEAQHPVSVTGPAASSGPISNSADDLTSATESEIPPVSFRIPNAVTAAPRAGVMFPGWSASGPVPPVLADVSTEDTADSAGPRIVLRVARETPAPVHVRGIAVGPKPKPATVRKAGAVAGKRPITAPPHHGATGRRPISSHPRDASAVRTHAAPAKGSSRARR